MHPAHQKITITSGGAASNLPLRYLLNIICIQVSRSDECAKKSESGILKQLRNSFFLSWLQKGVKVYGGNYVFCESVFRPKKWVRVLLLRHSADSKISDRQNVDKLAETADFV
jgi:hypothetical protein